jgi:hypothetical protein
MEYDVARDRGDSHAYDVKRNIVEVEGWAAWHVISGAKPERELSLAPFLLDWNRAFY